MNPAPPVPLDYDSARGPSDAGAAGLARRATLWAGLIGGAGAAVDRLARYAEVWPRVLAHDPYVMAWLTTGSAAVQVAALAAAVGLSAASAAGLWRPGTGRLATAAAELYLIAVLLRAVVEGQAYWAIFQPNLVHYDRVTLAIMALAAVADWLPILLPATLVLGTGLLPSAGRALILASAAGLAAATLVIRGVELFPAGFYLRQFGFAGSLGVSGRTIAYLCVASLACAASAAVLVGAWRLRRADDGTARRAAVPMAWALLVATLAPMRLDVAMDYRISLVRFAYTHGPLWASVPATLLLAAAIPAAVWLAFGRRGARRTLGVVRRRTPRNTG